MKKILIPVTVLFLVLVGCAALEQMVQIQKPQLNVDKVRLTGLSFDAVDLAFDVKIQNPNSLGINLAGFNYDFKLGAASFLQGRQDSQIVIQSLGESVLVFPLKLQFKDLYNAYQNLKNQDSTEYTMDFGLAFNLPILGPVNVPVSKSGHLPLLKLPKLDDISLQMKKLSFTSADLELKLDLDNPNAFALALTKLNYDFNINGSTWAKGLAAEPIQLSQKGKSAVRIPISLNLLQVGQSLYQMLTKKEQKFDYSLKANMDLQSSIPMLGQINLPVDKTGQLQILR